MAAAALAAAAVPCAGQTWDSTDTRQIVPGVVHKRLVANSGPWRVNVLEIDLRRPGIVLRGVRAGDSLIARETVSSMFERYEGPGRAVAAINRQARRNRSRMMSV